MSPKQLEYELECLFEKLHTGIKDSLISHDYTTWFYCDQIKDIVQKNKAILLTSDKDHIRQMATLFSKLEHPSERTPPERYPYPLTIIQDRYNGAYSNGLFIAFNKDPHKLPRAAFANDVTSSVFFSDTGIPHGVGATPDDATIDLISKIKKERTI